MMDNIHKADPGTLDLLEFILFSLLEDKVPVLFILAVNTDEAPDLINKILSKSPRDLPTHRYNLQPITRSAVEEWLLCLCQNDDKVYKLATRLHKEGEGRPFVIEEMLRVLHFKGYIITLTLIYICYVIICTFNFIGKILIESCL